MKLTDDDQELIDWFTHQDLPTGHFRINSYMTTRELGLTVELAIDSLKRDNDTSREVLRQVRDKLLAVKEPTSLTMNPTN